MIWRYTLFQSVLILALMVLAIPVADAYSYQEQLVVLGDESPPLSYNNENGVPSGELVDKVRDFLDDRVQHYSLHLVPWSRAIRASRSEENVIIFNLDRTAGREDDFHWLMALRETKYVFLSLHNEQIADLTLEEFIKGQYNVLCERDSAPCDHLLTIGIDSDRLIHFTKIVSPRSVEMILRGRADYIMVDSVFLDDSWVSNHLKLQALKVSSFDFSVTSYLAAHKKIAPEYLRLLLKDVPHTLGQP